MITLARLALNSPTLSASWWRFRLKLPYNKCTQQEIHRFECVTAFHMSSFQSFSKYEAHSRDCISFPPTWGKSLALILVKAASLQGMLSNRTYKIQMFCTLIIPCSRVHPVKWITKIWLNQLWFDFWNKQSMQKISQLHVLRVSPSGHPRTCPTHCEPTYPTCENTQLVRTQDDTRVAWTHEDSWTHGPSWTSTSVGLRNVDVRYPWCCPYCRVAFPPGRFLYIHVWHHLASWCSIFDFLQAVQLQFHQPLNQQLWVVQWLLVQMVGRVCHEVDHRHLWQQSRTLNWALNGFDMSSWKTNRRFEVLASSHTNNVEGHVWADDCHLVASVLGS